MSVLFFSYRSDLLTVRNTVHCEQLHAAVEACQSRISILSQQVKDFDINIKTFVKHLIRIYDEVLIHHFTLGFWLLKSISL